MCASYGVGSQSSAAVVVLYCFVINRKRKFERFEYSPTQAQAVIAKPWNVSVVSTATFKPGVGCEKAITWIGAEAVVGTVVALSMTRELGPVLTGLIVAGRAGAAMAAELGKMRVTEQIDALETLATNPLKYLIVPRLIAGTLMLPALAIVADLIGIIGGYFITVGLFDTSSIVYWKRTWNYLETSDIYNGLIKAGFFGASISLISCIKVFIQGEGLKALGRRQAALLCSPL